MSENIDMPPGSRADIAMRLLYGVTNNSNGMSKKALVRYALELAGEFMSQVHELEKPATEPCGNPLCSTSGCENAPTFGSDWCESCWAAMKADGVPEAM